MRTTVLTMLALMFAIAISEAQTIPNGGFENWSTPNGYNVPDDWGNLNPITSFGSVYTCTKGTPGSPGTSYIKLTSKTVAGLGVVPGIAVSGNLNTTTYMPTSGFAFAFRPTALTGNWQYMGASANDIGYIKAYLTKWNASNNTRDTVGYATQNLNGMVMSWASFNISFTYNNSDVPDTCLIILNASGANPENNSYLYVDNLSFTIPASSISTIEKVGNFTCFPNPANNFLTVDLTGIKGDVEKVDILDMLGRTLFTQNTNQASLTNIPLSGLSSGKYLVRVSTSNGSIHQIFIKE